MSFAAGPRWAGRTSRSARRWCITRSTARSRSARGSGSCACARARAAGVPRGPAGTTTAGLPPVQLFDLEADIGEKTNVQDKHPEVVARLTRLLETVRRRRPQHARPGAGQCRRGGYPRPRAGGR